MKTQLCIRCGHRLDIPENKPTPEEMQGKAFAECYCARCLKTRPVAEAIVAKTA